MSRRIAYVLAIVAGSAFVAPASADRECFDNTCRMPEVMEAPEAPETPPQAADEPKATADVAPAATASEPASGAARPQVAADAQPIEPLAKRPIASPQVPARQTAAQAAGEPSGEPVEVLAGRSYASAEPYAPHQAQPYPGAGIVIVVPGVQYGADGVALEQSRQDPSWRLCQTDRGNRPCTPYNYQPYGAYGYRPLGSYQPQRPASAYVHVPGAKVIVIDQAVTGSVK